jgi:S-adenosylmethionine:tRNA ribosyltransferase-isomerase
MHHSDPVEIERYRYDLPVSRIARYPLPVRDQSKLLLYDHGRISGHLFHELPGLIPSGGRLVFNDTRVIQARLPFRKPSGARIEIFCLEPSDPADYERAFRSTGPCQWHCLIGNAKKWKEGPVHMPVKLEDEEIILSAQKVGSSEEHFHIRFEWDRPGISFGEILDHAGQTPIPPYLNRPAEQEDRDRYQTIYSRDPGSVAAPTAGLHFTRGVMDRLAERGIRNSQVTLHVGTGTFVPVKEKDARDHSMHTELVTVSRHFIEEWAACPETALAVGTTTTRTLESLYWLGVKFHTGNESGSGIPAIGQWEDEQLKGSLSLKESLEALLGMCREKGFDRLTFTTRLMIVPGYRFRTIHGMITNFHMPGSTLLLLIAALIGEDWRQVYKFAMDNQYRFLSYGDSSLLLP